MSAADHVNDIVRDFGDGGTRAEVLRRRLAELVEIARKEGRRKDKEPSRDR